MESVGCGCKDEETEESSEEGWSTGHGRGKERLLQVAV